MSAVNEGERVRSSPRLVPVPPKAPPTKRFWQSIPWRRVGLYVVLIVSCLLLGAVPMWLKARENAAQLDLIQHELGLSQLENKLSEAVIDARRGEYEPARQTASEFFTALRNQLDKGAASAFSEPQRVSLVNLMSQRDEIITLLARGDPAAADRLSTLYVAYRKTMAGVQPENG